MNVSAAEMFRFLKTDWRDWMILSGGVRNRFCVRVIRVFRGSFWMWDEGDPRSARNTRITRRFELSEEGDEGTGKAAEVAENNGRRAPAEGADSGSCVDKH